MRRSILLPAVVGALLVTGLAEAAAPAAVTPSGSEIRSLIRSISREAGLEERLVHAVVSVESAYDPFAVSRKGAQGLMQLMPATARRLRVADPFDAEQNLRGGVAELARLIDRFAGDLELALAAYNAGETAVAVHGGVPPFRETRNYIRQVMSLYTGRSYSLPSANSRRPVRLLRQGEDGRIVMTNLPVGEPLSQRGLTASGAPDPSGRPVLRGGFGS